MRRVIVQYKVKPDRVDEHQGLVREVFEALEREKPTGLRYASFKLEDGVSFVHIAIHKAVDGGGEALTGLPEFNAFRAGMKDRCDELPVTTELTAVGLYNLGA